MTKSGAFSRFFLVLAMLAGWLSQPVRAQATSSLSYAATDLAASDGASSDRLGQSVAIDGDVLVSGADGADSDTGAAYVFVRSAGTWSQAAKLTASDRAAGDSFGRSVDISGDTIVVGAWGDDVGANNDQGSAYVFVKPVSGWGDATEDAKLTASDGIYSDNFGLSVSVSGNVVAVGSPLDDVSTHGEQGSVYVFVRPGGSWADGTETAKLTASDGESAGSGLGDQLGAAVAIDGDTIVAGAIYADLGADADRGAAYVFVKPGGGWATGNQTAKVNAGGYAGANQRFGYDVDLDGNTAIVGEPYYPGGTTYGAAYIFTGSGASWSQQSRQTPPSNASNLQYGYSVAVDGDTALVGVWDASLIPIPVSVYTRSGTVWDSIGAFATAASYGHAVALSGSTFAVGLVFYSVTSSLQGLVQAFVPDYDISVEASTPPVLLYPGYFTSIAVTVTNNGPTSTDPLTVSAPIPDGFTFNSGMTYWSRGDYDGVTGDWAIGILNSGDAATLHLYIDAGAAAADAITTFTATALVSAADSDGTNDSATALLTVGALSFNPSDPYFGAYLLGSTSPPLTVMATNLASSEVSIGQLALAVGSAFQISNDSCSNAAVAAGGTCTFDLEFAPVSETTYAEDMDVPLTNTTQQLHIVGLGKTGTGLQILEPSAFGSQLIMTSTAAKNVWVMNAITPDITVGTLSASPGFVLSNDTCTDALLVSGASCTFDVTFSPTSATAYSGSVTMPSTNGTDSIAVSGTGLAGTQLLANKGFDVDKNHNKVPDGWKKGGKWASADGRDTTVKRSGKASLKFTGNKALKTLSFTKLQAGVSGDDFLLTLFSKAKSVPNSATYRLTLNFYDGTTLVSTSTTDFAKGSHSWSKGLVPFTASASYTSVQVLIEFKATSGTAWFDDASLVWAP